MYYHENLYTLRNYVEKMEDYKRDLCTCVRGFHVYRATYGRQLFRKCLTVNPSPTLPALPDSHERLLLLVLLLRTKVSPLGPVNRPCAAGIAVEPFWPRSAVLRLHIRRLYNVLLFVVKNISCDKFSWFEPTTKIF